MKSVLLKILLILSLLPFSQVWGADFIPAITNYTVKDYEGGHQNWACAQGDDGVMYFGNNNGLLVYDGFPGNFTGFPVDILSVLFLLMAIEYILVLSKSSVTLFGRRMDKCNIIL